MEMVHFFMFSSLLFLTKASSGLPGVVSEMLLVATVQLVTYFMNPKFLLFVSSFLGFEMLPEVKLRLPGLV